MATKAKSAAIKTHPGLPMPHPGTLLAEDITATGESKVALAARLGISRRALYDILEGRSAVTAGMALRLEATVGSSAEMWLGMQTQHDLWQARSAVKVKVRA